MKVKSILAKTAAVAAVSVTGVVAMNSANQETVHAATVENDAEVVTVNYVDGNSIRVWNSYQTPEATGQVLPSNSSWKVIKTAYDQTGHKWYDLGKNQWVKAEYVNKGYYPEKATDQEAVVANNSATSTADTSANYNTNTQNYASLSDSESDAKGWIANRESGGSYSAQNGQYIGKYQLSASYLNGDYSAANQERVANSYVASRYGSWSAAKAFWQANGWY